MELSITEPDGDWDGWQVERDGVHTEIRYHRYEDLVRAHQSGGLPARLGRGLRALLGYLASGAVARLPLRTNVLMIAPYLIAFMPVALLGWLSSRDMTAALVVGFAAALSAYLFLVRYRVILLSDLFAYLRSLAGGHDATARSHTERVDALVADLSPGVEDETLVVGHSLGGVAAIRATAALAGKLEVGQSIGLLTLGSVHGIVLAQGGAGADRLAEDIASLCGDKRVFWVDVSSPRDAFCVPLTDPRLLIGERVRDAMVAPTVIAAQLRHAPKIPGDRRTVFSAMRRHMGYLLEAPKGAGFDYAETVSGMLSLRARFGHRQPSPKARMWRG